MRSCRITYSGAILLGVMRNEISKILKMNLNRLNKYWKCYKKENINAVCCWTPFLTSFRLTQLNGEKIRKVEMLVLHEKRCSTATHTPSQAGQMLWNLLLVTIFSTRGLAIFCWQRAWAYSWMTHSRTANHSETKQLWQIRLIHQTIEWCAKNHRTGTFKRLQTPSLLVDVERFETDRDVMSASCENRWQVDRLLRFRPKINWRCFTNDSILNVISSILQW